MKLFLLSTLVAVIFNANAFAGEISVLEEVPTLGEWGMIAMVIALGVIGFLALRKRLPAHAAGRD